MDLREAFEKAIIANELSNHITAAYRLSRATGGTSGYSFGVTQLDISNNPAAAICLAECGFTPSEIATLKTSIVVTKPFDARLLAHATIIDKYDDRQLDECLHHVLDLAITRRFSFADDFAIVVAADYHNQLNMSRNGRLASFCVALGRPVAGQDIYQLKMSIDWGKEEPEDVDRRYNNIAKIFGRPLKGRGPSPAEGLRPAGGNPA
jgi:hypothetical protein